MRIYAHQVEKRVRLIRSALSSAKARDLLIRTINGG